MGVCKEPHASRLTGGVTRGWNFAIAPIGAKKINSSFFYPEYPAHPVKNSSSFFLCDLGVLCG
jgi:hypothetical protein